MALAPLAPIVAALFALGLAVLLTVLTLALVQFLSKAPVFGGWIADKAAGLEQTISHALGVAFGGIDSFIGGSIHQLARFMDRLWNTIVSIPHTMLRVAEALVPISAAIHAVRQIAHLAHAIATTIAHRFVTIGHEISRLTHRVKVLERDVAKGIGDDVLPRIKSLDREIAKIENSTIPAIRAAEAEASAAIENLYEWAKGKASLLNVGTFATAVAAAIGLELWKGLRCPSLLNSITKRGCGLWQGLEDILGLLIDALLLVNLCEIPVWINTIFGPFEAELVDLVSTAATAVCAQPNQSWTALGVPALHLPTTAEVTETL